MWEYLPDILLENIFSHLTIRERYSASMVCSNWYRIYNSPQVWSTFIMHDRLLTRRKFNYYMGWEYVFDHYRAQICLHRIGHYLKKILIRPMSNFFNLSEFNNMMSNWAEFYDDNPLDTVHTFNFTFACHLTDSGVSSEMVFGTGGQILKALKRLISNLKHLRELALNDLLLEKNDALHLLDDVVLNCCDSIRKLRLVNCTSLPCPILHLGVFLNMTELTVSPQQLSDDIVALICNTSLRHLYIVQNLYTDQAQAVSFSAWRDCRKTSIQLQVHLLTEGNIRRDIIWQEGAPVTSISYSSAYIQLSTVSVLTAVEFYGNDLQVYAHHGLPRFHMPKSFHERCDSSLVLLCRQCPNLHTLVVRQLVSTATVLLIAWTAKKLKNFYIRRNAIVKKADWPHSPEWSMDFYVWLKNTARSYELLEQEVSRILGITWRPLCDKDFKLLSTTYRFEPLPVREARRRSTKATIPFPLFLLEDKEDFDVK